MLLPNFSLLYLDCGAAKRPRRAEGGRGQEAQGPAMAIEALAATATDDTGAVVYADLAREDDALLTALRSRLVASQPSERVLERLAPINKGRLLVEIDDDQTLAIFEAWLLDTWSDLAIGPSLARLLSPLGDRLRILGAQWIVPRVTEYDRSIQAQTPHTDVDRKGEVISIAVHVGGGAMGTLISPSASIDEDGEREVSGWDGYKRANTGVFAYDTGVVHAGPGRANVPPPYPQYFRERVFFLLCPESLDLTRAVRHRRDNGLRSTKWFQHNRIITLPRSHPPTNAATRSDSTALADVTASTDARFPASTPFTPP